MKDKTPAKKVRNVLHWVYEGQNTRKESAKCPSLVYEGQDTRKESAKCPSSGE